MMGTFQFKSIFKYVSFKKKNKSMNDLNGDYDFEGDEFLDEAIRMVEQPFVSLR